MGILVSYTTVTQKRGMSAAGDSDNSNNVTMSKRAWKLGDYSLYLEAKSEVAERHTRDSHLMLVLSRTSLKTLKKQVVF